MFAVNGVSFVSPSVPVLLQILSGTQNASDLLPSGSVYGLEADKSVELTIPAFAVAGPVSASVAASLCPRLTLSSLASHPPARCKYLHAWQLPFRTLTLRLLAFVPRCPQCWQHVLQLRQPRRARRRKHWHRFR